MVKLTAAAGIVVAAVLGAILFLNLNQLKTVTVANGEQEAVEAGREYATTFKDTFTEITASLTTLSELLLDTRDDQSLSREEAVSLMKGMLAERPDVFALYTLWEPGAFDGNDAAYRGKTAYDDRTGRFVPFLTHGEEGIKAVPLRDYETPGAGDYYLLPKASKKLTYIEPYSYEVSGEQIQMMSVVQPIVDESGRFLGIVGMDVSLAYLQVEAQKYKPLGGYVSLITSKGLYAANPNDPDSILQPYGDNPEKEALWQDVAQGSRLTGYTLNSKGLRVLRVFEPVLMPGSDQVWYTQSAIPEATVMEKYTEAQRRAILTVVLAMAAMAAIMALLVRLMVVRPLRTLSEKLQLMAGGDLTQQLPVRSGDEFGRMAGHFNVMTSKLRGMFGLVADLTMAASAASQQLTAGAEQTGKAAETITGSISRVAEGAQQQNDYASESAVAMNEMTLGVQRIAASSSAVTVSAQEVAEQTRQGSDRLQHAVIQMEDLQQSVEDTGNAVARLEERSVQIGGMIGLISAISQQTNLLALNAAIEASRAGDQGRGFAVVASEIRKLADQTKQAAEQVAELVADVRTDTVKASEAMEAGKGKVLQGVQSVKESGGLFVSILSEMGQVNGQIEEVSAAAEQLSASTGQISASVEQLAALASEASSDSQSVAAASEEQLASMEEISSSAAALGDMVQELVEKLSHFKV
ncbi:methyl-accepting chemotaxis protein [Paenibacillus sp. N4]|nr:methyl-accepting chemotaxis protein [Paenibacillus vietnamensis]